MNEATLEARISAVISKVFPTFKKVNVEHQTSFSLKIGHHNLTVDSKSPKRNMVRAISDILFKIDDQNIILLELKNDSIKILEDDISQGISYARLLDQMPPITLISNGHDNKFYNTYTREAIDRETLDFEFIQDAIDNSFALALKDLRDAISFLLNNDPDLFSQIINSVSAEKFVPLVGTVYDYQTPIAEDFNVVTRNKQESLEQLKVLIMAFNKEYAVYKTDKYKEAQLRIDFLNPFLKTFGWDVDNEEGKSTISLKISMPLEDFSTTKCILVNKNWFCPRRSPVGYVIFHSFMLPDHMVIMKRAIMLFSSFLKRSQKMKMVLMSVIQSVLKSPNMRIMNLW